MCWLLDVVDGGTGGSAAGHLGGATVSFYMNSESGLAGFVTRPQTEPGKLSSTR